MSVHEPFPSSLALAGVITILCHNDHDDDNDASCCSVEHYYSIIMSKRSEHTVPKAYFLFNNYFH